MDSLTQITLGAAVGEIVLGRKLGNKAMLWGAIGGTVPDLDIVGNFFMTEMEALVFHRGISHSFFFSVVASFPLAYLMIAWYKRSWRTSSIYRWIKFGVWALLLAALIFGIYSLFKYFDASHSWLILALGLLGGVGVMYQYRKREWNEQLDLHITYKQAYLLFFWAILTHILLDVFTAYGTQVLQPFHNFRLAYSSISIVDPLYTVPLLGSVIVASFFARTTPVRRKWVLGGLIVSSIYLAGTLVTQQYVKRIFQKTLVEEGFAAERIYVTPTILNNVLWHCVAQSSDDYWIGSYSLFDSTPLVTEVASISGSHGKLSSYRQSKDVQDIVWFSDGYFSVIPSTSDTVFIGDLRYGGAPSSYSKPSDFIFSFKGIPSDGSLSMQPIRNNEGDPREMIRILWSRIKGI